MRDLKNLSTTEKAEKQSPKSISFDLQEAPKKATTQRESN